MSNLWTPGSGGEAFAGGNPLGGLGNINTEGPRGQINDVTTALTTLRLALNATTWQTAGTGISTMLKNIGEQAKKTAEDIGEVSTAVSRAGSGGGGDGGSGGPTWLNNATSSASAATAAAGGGAAAAAGGGMAPAGITLPVMSQGANLSGKDMMKSLALFPLRFMRSMIDMNRGNALTASSALGMQGYATGVSNAGQMDMLSKLPGNVRGTQADILSLFANAPQFGAMFGMGAQQNAPRAAGYLESVRQMQAMNPGAPVAELAGTVGGFASNAAQARQSQMVSGGAYAMVRPGGGMKTVQEWAESILRWLEGLRPGGQRGKAFTYGDLISQYFPGSNIDAWFEVQGVPQNMREYFWTYALGKTKGGGGTQDPMQQIGPDTKSIAYQRLAATTSMTQSQFKLGGQMAGSYANREQANRWFNDKLGSFINRVIPSAVSQGALQYAQYLPDTVEQILMTIMENSGALGSVFGGIIGYGGAFENDDDENTSGVWNSLKNQGLWDIVRGNEGDVPERGPLGIGDVYTTTGGTGTAGLHPDMRRKVGAMMKANPKLRVTSGLRDNAMQQRLKKRGVGRVSGRPSAHTRGMAADLGPSSQYGWIVNNASKFGLSSGISHGEPWHVGMGDVFDLTDAFTSTGGFLLDMFKGLKGMFEGGSDPAGNVAGLITPFFELLGGLMATEGVDASKLEFQPGLYERMHGLAGSSHSLGGGIQAAIKGGMEWLATGRGGSRPAGGLSRGGGNIPSRPTFTTTPQDPHGWASIAAAQEWDRQYGGQAGGGGGGGGASGASRGGGGGGNLDQFFRQVLQGLGAPVTSNNLAKLGAIAKVEGNNSGTYNPFNSTGGEFPNKFNSVGVENYPDWATGVQYTIRQIQMSSGEHGIRMSQAKANLLNDGSYADWQSKMGAFYSGWGGQHGASLLGRISSSTAAGMLSHQVGMGDAESPMPAADIDELAHQAVYRPMPQGVGDAGMSYAAMMPTSSAPAASQSLVTFNNTFTISGGGSGGGIDLRRTVSTIADHLEQEMKQRMVRMN